MTETLVETPLFPLNVVLVPGMALPLHIFEPRYRQMIAECLDSNMPMGIVLSVLDSLTGHEMPARIGTLARIADYERLPNGRYNLLAVGTRRFEIVELRHDHCYLSALVRLLSDEEDASDLRALALAARTTLDEYLQHVLAIVGSEYEMHIPDTPIELSYVMVMCLGRDDSEKQRLLELSSTARRLELGTEMLRADIADLTHEAERHAALN